MCKRIFVFAIFIVLLICSSIIAAKFEPFMQIQQLVVGTIKGDGAQLTGLTKAQVGLSNVDNTSDVNKPISSATQTALNNKEGTQTPASQAEAEAGTEAGIRSWSPLRIFQGIASWWNNTGRLAPGAIGDTTPSRGTFSPLKTPTSTPSTSTYACETGTIAWDTDYIYICVATNTWKRVPLASW